MLLKLDLMMVNRLLVLVGLLGNLSVVVCVMLVFEVSVLDVVLM